MSRREISLLIAFVCLSVAQFLAWRDTHYRADGLEAELRRELPTGWPEGVRARIVNGLGHDVAVSCMAFADTKVEPTWRAGAVSGSMPTWIFTPNAGVLTNLSLYPIVNTQP